MYYLGADKHGWQVLKMVEGILASQGIPFTNLGVQTEHETVKLEDFIPLVAKSVLSDPAHHRGILICGTGIGVTIGANKFTGIRAHLATSEEQAQWSRQYDNCNVLCLVGWKAQRDDVQKILTAWLRTEYDGDQGRQAMFKAFDSWS